jgi:hypothetical protein
MEMVSVAQEEQIQLQEHLLHTQEAVAEVPMVVILLDLLLEDQAVVETVVFQAFQLQVQMEKAAEAALVVPQEDQELLF